MAGRFPLTATLRNPRAGHAGRIVRRSAFVALLAGVAAAGIAVRCIMLPPQDPLPAHADVAFVLGPVTHDRLATAHRLLDRGVVSTILISIPLAAKTPGSPDQRRYASCAARTDVICDSAEPHTTRGEARMLERHAVEHGWSSAIVITQTAHLLRARLLVGRCFSGGLTMAASGEPPEGGWPYQFAYQIAATAKAWANPAC